MFCQHCGNKMEDSAMFCPSCGQKVAGAVSQQPNAVPEVQSSPFMSTPAPEVQNSPFMSTPAPEVQNSPFMSTPAPEAQSSPFMNSTPVQQGTPANNMANPFATENRQPPMENVQNIPPLKEKKQKAKAGKKEPKEKKEDNQSTNIVIMGVAQVIFIAFICYMGITGKFNNSLGEINLGYTIVVLLVIMAINVVLYALLFTGKKKKPIAPPPPIERPKTDVRKAPTYMSDIINNHNTGIPDMDVVEDGDCPTEVTLSDEGFDDATEVIEIPVVVSYPKLEYIEDGIKKEILINKDEFIIGRLRGRVDFITTNKKIGRIHAAIITRDGSYFVKDFNSQNKTYINRGGAIAPEQEYAINNNDVISFADSEFTFKLPE